MTGIGARRWCAAHSKNQPRRIGGRSEGGKVIPAPNVVAKLISEARPINCTNFTESGGKETAQEPATQQPSSPQHGMCLPGTFLPAIS